jgi:hypothetical protein
VEGRVLLDLREGTGEVRGLGVGGEMLDDALFGELRAEFSLDLRKILRVPREKSNSEVAVGRVSKDTRDLQKHKCTGGQSGGGTYPDATGRSSTDEDGERSRRHCAVMAETFYRNRKMMLVRAQGRRTMFKVRYFHCGALTSRSASSQKFARFGFFIIR